MPGLLWGDGNEIWTTTKDGVMTQIIVEKMQRRMDRVNTSCVGWNVFGELAFAMEERAALDQVEHSKKKKYAVVLFNTN